MPSQISKADVAWHLRAPLIEHLGPRLWTYLNGCSVASERESVLIGLTKLPREDFGRLVDQRLATSREVQRFTMETAPSVLRGIAKSTEAEPQTGWGRIKGTIDWPRTVAARRESGGLPGRHAWRSTERTYDLPENRLFKYALESVRRVGRRAAGAGQPTTATIGQWRDTSARVALAAERHLGNVALRNVEDTERLDSRAWQRAWGHRRSDYRAVAEFLSWLLRARLRGSTENWQLLAATYLVPLSNDSLFELFVLVKALQAAEGLGWKPVELRAVGAQLVPVFRLARDNAKCDFFYQHTPTELKERSEYIAMFRDTGIPTAVRRPDIVIRMSSAERCWFGFIEVKRTTSPSYISDSIYKCLGYLGDFTVIDAQMAPKAALVVLGGVKGTFKVPSDVLVLTASGLARRLQPFLAGALDSINP